MQRVKRRFHGVHNGKVLPWRLVQKIAAFGKADAVLTGGHAAELVGLGIGGIHIGMQLALPCAFITAAADNAQMYVAVAGMAEADHLHAGGRFQFVDEADEICRMADGHHDVHWLLLRNGFHRFDQCTTDLPDVCRLCRIGEHI